MTRIIVIVRVSKGDLVLAKALALIPSTGTDTKIIIIKKNPISGKRMVIARQVLGKTVIGEKFDMCRRDDSGF